MLDVSACVAAAAVCDQQAAAIIGSGTEKQFTFTGVIGEQKPLRDWMAEVLANCLGGYAFAFGKFRPYVRFHSGVAESFQEGNIVKGSLALGSIAASFNKLVATFADRDYATNRTASSLSIRITRRASGANWPATSIWRARLRSRRPPAS